MRRTNRRGIATAAVLVITAVWFARGDARAQGPDPKPRADLGAARELARAGKYEEADRLLADLQNTFPDDPSLLNLRGEVLNASGHPDQAAPLLRHSIELAPEKPRVHFNLATALSKLGEKDGALEAYAQELALNPDPKVQVLAHLNRSILLVEQKKLDDAAGEIEKALTLEPDRKEAYADLANIYLDAGHPTEAARTIEKGMEFGASPSGLLQYRLGAAFYNQKAYDKAVEAFRSAIGIQTDLAQAELSLAKALDQLGRTDEANEHLKRYLELRPTSAEAGDIKKRLAGPPKKASNSKGAAK